MYPTIVDGALVGIDKNPVENQMFLLRFLHTGLYIKRIQIKTGGCGRFTTISSLPS